MHEIWALGVAEFEVVGTNGFVDDCEDVHVLVVVDFIVKVVVGLSLCYHLLTHLFQQLSDSSADRLVEPCRKVVLLLLSHPLSAIGYAVICQVQLHDVFFDFFGIKRWWLSPFVLIVWLGLILYDYSYLLGWQSGLASLILR